jgi:hypothetical protein
MTPSQSVLGANVPRTHEGQNGCDGQEEKGLNMKRLTLLAALMLVLAANPVRAQEVAEDSAGEEQYSPIECGQYCVTFDDPVGEIVIGDQDEQSADGGQTTGAAGENAGQSLQQVGGQQYSTAVGAGVGDVAAANNGEFDAAQVQQSTSVAGEDNAAAQNVGDATSTASDAVGDRSSEGDVDRVAQTGGSSEVSAGTSGAEAGAGGSGSDGDPGGSDTGDGGAEASTGGSGDDSGSEGSGATLPGTGGYSLIALGAGALLVAGGLVARRIVG